MPTLTGTLVDDAHDLDTLAGVALGDLPFGAYYIAGIDIGIPVSDVEPTDPDDWIQGTRWQTIKGRAWPETVGTRWPMVRKP